MASCRFQHVGFVWGVTMTFEDIDVPVAAQHDIYMLKIN